MYSHRQLFHEQAHAGRFDSRIALLSALLIFVLIAPAAFAQTAQGTNAYPGAVNDVSSDDAPEIQTAIAAEPLAAQNAFGDPRPDNGFSKNGPWNTKLPPNVPLAPNSAAIVANIVQDEQDTNRA